jgi:hypothetical protein
MKAQTITKTQIDQKYFGVKIQTLVDYDEAILGVDLATKKVCYSITKLIDITMALEKRTFEDAVKYVKAIVQNCSDDYTFIDDIF